MKSLFKLFLIISFTLPGCTLEEWLAYLESVGIDTTQPVESGPSPTPAANDTECEIDADCDYFDQELSCEGDRIGTHEGVCMGGQCNDHYTTQTICVSGCNTETKECLPYLRLCETDQDCQQWQSEGKLCVNTGLYSYKVGCDHGACYARKTPLEDCAFGCNVAMADGCFPYTGNLEPYPSKVSFRMTEEGLLGQGIKLQFDITAHGEDVEIKELEFTITDNTGLWTVDLPTKNIFLRGGENGIISPDYYFSEESCWSRLNELHHLVSPGEKAKYLVYRSDYCAEKIILKQDLTRTEFFGLSCPKWNPSSTEYAQANLLVSLTGALAIGLSSGTYYNADYKGDIEGLPISLYDNDPIPFWQN